MQMLQIMGWAKHWQVETSTVLYIERPPFCCTTTDVFRTPAPALDVNSAPPRLKSKARFVSNILRGDFVLSYVDLKRSVAVAGVGVSDFRRSVSVQEASLSFVEADVDGKADFRVFKSTMASPRSFSLHDLRFRGDSGKFSASTSLIFLFFGETLPSACRRVRRGGRGVAWWVYCLDTSLSVNSPMFVGLPFNGSGAFWARPKSTNAYLITQSD